MPKLPQARKLEQRKRELVQTLAYTKRLKQNLEIYNQKLDSSYNEGKIHYLQYKDAQRKALEGRSVQEWIQYYDQCISYYEKEIAYNNTLVQKEIPKQLWTFVLSIILLSLIGFSAYTGYDTFVETTVSEEVAETSPVEEVVQEEVVEQTIDSENTESAADIPEANILPIEEDIVEELPYEENNESEETPFEDKNQSEEEIEIPLEENQSGIIIPQNNFNEEEQIVIVINETKKVIENISIVIPFENISEEIVEINISQKQNFTLEFENITNLSFGNISLPIITFQENLTQYNARVGDVVRWDKKISFANETTFVSIELPKNAELISVTESGQEISLSAIKVNSSGILVDVRSTNILTEEAIPLSFFGGLFNLLGDFFNSITGFAVLEEEIISKEENISLIIEESMKEIVVAYYTEAPQAFEENRANGKKVTISSETHYENILSYTTVPDIEVSNIQLYWLVNDTRKLFSFDAYDTNNNSLIDYIEWITPSLSNQSFEVDLIILTVQSYPTVGGNWTVQFNTTGTATLTINAYNNTQWSNDSLDKDLKFLDVFCGSQVQNYNWTNSSVVIENYTCNNVGTETSMPLTLGIHTLQFVYGNNTKYAYNEANYATCPDSAGNVTINVNTVWSNASFNCNSIEIISNAILTLNNTAAGNTTITINANNINITSGAMISVSEQGFLPLQGSGAPSSDLDAGAGYGGQGGESGSGAGGFGYGSVTQPLDLGSGGGSSTRAKGRGAGAVYLNVTETLTVNGIINASATISNEGGGSGGSIYINATRIQGSGLITVQGGRVTASNDGAGSGGRIAIYYSQNNFTGQLNASSGGAAATSTSTAGGGAGTIYLKSDNQTYGELFIDNNRIMRAAPTTINSTFLNKVTLDNLTISNWSYVILENIANLSINNTLFEIDNGTTFYQNAPFISLRVTNLTIGGTVRLSNAYTFNNAMDVLIQSTGILFHRNNSNIQEFSLNISARNFTILSGGLINLSDTGYQNGSGPGTAPSGSNDAGAGYGGLGGEGSSTSGGSQYGSVTQPLDLGSGGHSGTSNGFGAGLLRLNISNTLSINGTIDVGAVSSGEGGGSGGSIYINTSSFTGVGSLSTDGGSLSIANDGGGSGGRIAIYYGNKSFTGTISASGGTSADISPLANQFGGAGTIYMKAYNQSYGDLLIDNGRIGNGTQTILNSTFFSLTNLDNFTISNYSRVILQDISNLTINNTIFEIDSAFTEFYQYANFHAPRLENFTISGTILFGTNSTFNKSMNVWITSTGNVSHKDNTPTTYNRVNITARNLTILSGGVINVSYAGYIQDTGPGTPSGASSDQGAGYGGQGGSSVSAKGGDAYGSFTAPFEFGSGGDFGATGINGRGAGAIYLNITDTIIVNGTISASALPAAEGAGSGGSVYITSTLFTGVGNILSEGGRSTIINDGAGGGGRIALYFINRTFSGAISVSGGSSGSAGLEGDRGSLFICQYVSGMTCIPTGNLSTQVSNGSIILRTEFSHNSSFVVNQTMNISWPFSSMNWTIESNNFSAFVINNLSGVNVSTNFSIYDNGTINKSLISDANGALALFNMTAVGTHDISVRRSADVSVVGINIDDGAIAFGSGYYNASCTQGYSSINSNTSRSCWINTTAFPETADVHLISNNGTVAVNVTASLQIQDAEALFCGSSGGCSITDTALISIAADNNETNSCTGLSTFNNLSTHNSNRTASLCNSLASADSGDQIKTWMHFQVPRDTTVGAKSLVIVYEALAA
ncbi:MAG: hypothetical protein Q8R18_02810 [bacterium]|nr:hypothetical protein [bacterium]